VQNCLARVITKSPPLTRSIPLLHSLHWLPVRSRIDYKLCLLTFKTITTTQPSYLRDLLTISVPARSLRHNKGTLLKVPRMKSKTGTRAFHSCAPTLWNSLPLTVRSANSSSTFRKLLKTHLFRLSFPP
jgi:hypothetical protein